MITFEVGSCILYSQLKAVFTYEDAVVKKKQKEIVMTGFGFADIVLQYCHTMRTWKASSKKSPSLGILEDGEIFMTSCMGDAHSLWD